MRKILYIFVMMIMALIVTGCNETDTEIPAENQPAIVKYEDIAPETIQLLEDYMQKINLILELSWNGRYADELRFEAEEFKKVLEILYEDSTGELFPQKNGEADIKDYLNIAEKFFNIDTDYLRRILSLYMYDFAKDTVTVAPDVDADGILTIRDICQKDGIYEISFSRKYETYNEETGSYQLGNITQGVLKVQLDENGSCIFLSNRLNRTEYEMVSGVDLDMNMWLRTYAMGDILNYSWSEQGAGSLSVDENYKAIQYSMEKMYLLYNDKEFPAKESDAVKRYLNYTRKFFDFDEDYLRKALGFTVAVKDIYPVNDYKTDDNHFILFKGIKQIGDYIYVNYANGIRNYDSHTNRYELLDAVESTLVFKYFKSEYRYKAVANINAYYDVKDKDRYNEYLNILLPALDTNWDESTDNPLTQKPEIMKRALQNIHLHHNFMLEAGDEKYSADTYRYAAEKFFVFGNSGFEAMLKNDESYNNEDDTLSAASNDSANSNVKITSVVYEDGYRVVSYEKDGTGGRLTVKRYADGSEKISANKYDYRRLTLEEIERVNEYYRNNISWQYVVDGLTGKPEEIDVSDIVNSLPAEGLLTYKNYYEIKQRKEAGVNLDYSRLERGLEEYGKVSAQTVEKLLLETVNISLDQLEKDVKTNYSPSYNCFYKTDNYVTRPYMQFVDGYAIDDSVVLYDKGERILTLKKQGENYYLYSLEINKEDNIKDIYEENGISTETQYFVRDTYFEPQPDKSESYNYAIKDYNEFLSGNIYVNGEHCEPEKWIEWYEGAETPISRYGLFDLNSDGIPELILYIPYNCYEVYSHDGYRMGTMTQWDVKFDGGMSGPGMIFRDGTAGEGRISTGAGYSFYKYDKNGNCNRIMEFSWYEPWNDYNFNGKHVSKEEFEKLADPWLDKFDTEADTGAKTYFLEKEYWELYADKLA